MSNVWDGVMKQIEQQEGGVDKFLNDLYNKQNPHLMYENVVVNSNWGKTYLVKLKGKDEPVELIVGADTPDDMICLYCGGWDGEEYFEKDVDYIIEELPCCEDVEEDSSDSFSKIDFEYLNQYEYQENIYKYSTYNELEKILNSFGGEVYIEGLDFGNGFNIPQDLTKLSKDEYGLVVYWNEYDDYSCYGDGFTHKVRIISGVK